MFRPGGPDPLDPLDGARPGAQAAMEAATAVRQRFVAARVAGPVARAARRFHGVLHPVFVQLLPAAAGRGFTLPTTA